MYTWPRPRPKRRLTEGIGPRKDDPMQVLRLSPASAPAVHLRRAALTDAEALHRMKHDAFWPLYEKYHDDATSPALEMLGKLRSQLDHPAADWYLILREGEPVGGMRIVRERTDGGLPCCRISPLFILPEHRGKGYGKALLRKLASLAVDRGCGRMEWWCLDWNQPSIDFYRSLGAEPMNEWTVYRLTGETLERLANELID